MSSNITQGLLIAAIGMGLVFLALILLWGLMSLMASIRFKSDHKDQEAEPGAAEPAESETVEAGDAGESLRMQAAAAAVAAALALRGRAFRAVPPAPKVFSPWQAARRSGQFSQNSLVTSRKSRGSAR